ncbi:MAG TPA: DNA cytosine methyltransferase [Acidimicrobiia bacterium]
MTAQPTTVASLFAGIGGLELGLHKSGFKSVYACEYWSPARAVLASRFPGIRVDDDILDVKQLPRADVVTAGFPCTDLSQAGRTAGIAGDQSGLVAKALDLVEDHACTWLVLENVRNMLPLHGGRAMAAITERLENLGFRWAYRLVDSRFSGVPQRRQRVIFVASRSEDPRAVLFADDATDRPASSYRDDAYGFYWTEGLRGLGWAQDAIPTLKGGSTIGIPSPPAIWLPDADPENRFVLPGISAGERLQGFRTGWTKPAVDAGFRTGARWKLVGNAVTVGVSRWIGGRLRTPGDMQAETRRLDDGERWPTAAWGSRRERFAVKASMWPERKPFKHLRDVLRDDTTALSHRGAAGFLSRLDRGGLRGFPDEFRVDMKNYVELTRPAS